MVSEGKDKSENKPDKLIYEKTPLFSKLVIIFIPSLLVFSLFFLAISLKVFLGIFFMGSFLFFLTLTLISLISKNLRPTMWLPTTLVFCTISLVIFIIAVSTPFGLPIEEIKTAEAKTSTETTAPPTTKAPETTAPPTTTAPETTAPPTTTEKKPIEEKKPDDATLGEKNALRTALNYLSFMSFSYSGLVEQLKFEGYTQKEAVYGADNCGADWNEQAVLTAEKYLDYGSFSRSGLIEQLEYEGFTSDQAEYGVKAVGY